LGELRETSITPYHNHTLPANDTEDLSVASFDASHKSSGKVADDNDSLAMAQASIAGMG